MKLYHCFLLWLSWDTRHQCHAFPTFTLPNDVHHRPSSVCKGRVQRKYIHQVMSLSKKTLLHEVSSTTRDTIQDLPIMDILDSIQEHSCRQNEKSNLLLQCPPGAGKTTIVPLAMSSFDPPNNTNIILIEPRRVATRTAAFRMASLIGQNVGQKVGYAIRGESKVSSHDTVITVMTDGVLLNKLRDDPELLNVDIVIFDEWHERGVGSDTALALVREVQANVRPDLKIVVMSATLLGEDSIEDDSTLTQSEWSTRTWTKLYHILGGTDLCTILKSEGRQYPISIQYAKRSSPLHGVLLNDSKILVKTMADSIEEGLLRAPSKGDVLAFLPGAKEIKKVIQELKTRRIDADVYPLYGSLPKVEQDLAIFKTDQNRRKVIVSSPIAEASLTIEGVTCVVDSGFKREPRFDPSTGLPHLVTVVCSQDSAIQRAGRAGRTENGYVIRLFTEGDFARMNQHSVPEICSTDLVPTVLLLSEWGMSSPSQILEETYFVDPPPLASLHQAYEMLLTLEALEEYSLPTLKVKRYRITPHGKEMSQLPTHPRFANAIMKASSQSPEYLVAAVTAAALIDDEIGSWGGDPNLGIRIKECLSTSPNSAEGRALLKFATRISNKARDETLKAMNDTKMSDLVSEMVGRALLPGFIDLVAQFKGEASYGGCTYKLSLGQSARLDGSRDEGKYILVIDTTTGDDGITRIRMYSKIDLNHLNEVSKEYREVYAVQSKGYEVRARKVTRVGHLELSSTTLPTPPSDEVAKVLVDTIVELGGVYKAIIPQQPKKVMSSIIDLQYRLRLARKLTSEESWPLCFRAFDNTEHGIQTEEDEKLLLDLVEPWLIAAGSLKGLDMYEILLSSLSAEQQYELDSIVPTNIIAPDGSPIPVDYTNDTPTVAAKLQQFFGTTDSPSIGPANNSIPVSISLLSPSGKQLALCNDLNFFWKETYPSVRAEMRGRYPKHPWPEDPFSIEPSRLSKKQQQSQNSSDEIKTVDKRKEKSISRKKKN